MNKFNK